MKLLLVLFALGVLGFVAWTRRGSRKAPGWSVEQRAPDAPAPKRVRLTEQQILVLMCATKESSIYGENPAMRGAQMPDGAMCFSLRTIESLIRRGYLREDGAGGYRITDSGEAAVRDV